MSDTFDIRVPDIGDFKDVPVIEVLVKPGETIAKETPLLVLESEKASLEVPSSADGVVQDVKVRVGDKVSQGNVILTLENAATTPSNGERVEPAGTVDLVVPDIGDFTNVLVTEVLVKPGQTITKEAPLVVLESEKASMDVPASTAGTIVDVKVRPGDKVSQGTVLATLAAAITAATTGEAAPGISSRSSATSVPSAAIASETVSEAHADAPPALGDAIVHASPAIRRFARELGVDLQALRGSGPRGRVTREDVQGFVKFALRGGDGVTTTAGGTPHLGALPPWPRVDFAQYGPIERAPLSRIKKFSGPNLHRNWIAIPHITNYDEADITDLEAFRNEVNAEQSKRGAPKLTMLAFLVKAVTVALVRFPEFNASLDGDAVVLKRYYNVGFAADTPNGLVVPVLRSANEKSLLTIAAETAELAGKAREGKLALGEMQGGTFTISSIGGIGGTAFTQIVNAPEVAILGAVRSSIKPQWNGDAFVPRLLLPISLSYDHRVIDGAGAARFLVYVAALLADFRRVTL